MCIRCGKNESIYDPVYGKLPYCLDCQKQQADLTRPGQIPEMTSDSIKEGRKMYYDDIHPAHYKGQASREFLERWGEKAMKRQGFTDKEIKNSKYVYAGNDTYYKKGN